MRWGEQKDIGDVAFMEESAVAARIDFSDPPSPQIRPAQVARGAIVSDARGQRQTALFFPANVHAHMRAHGMQEELSSGALRITEYTVGDRGPVAMPASLPPHIAYTWAAEFSFDEAVAEGAESVEFDAPVAVYVDNFLRFPVGSPVPAGYFSREDGAWVANHGNQIPDELGNGNGIIINVLPTTDSGGGADLDLTGDGVADTSPLAAHGITLEERQQLRVLYPEAACAVSKKLWRVRVTHFTTWDFNWGFSPPPNAEVPDVDVAPSRQGDCESVVNGSEIHCENRALGESIPLPGTPFNLRYLSDRTAGYKWVIDMPLGVPDPSRRPMPSGVLAVSVDIQVAGQHYTHRWPAAQIPGLRAHYAWDGNDVYGRRVQGTVPATIQVGYEYQSQYGAVERFGHFGNGTVITTEETSGSPPGPPPVTLWSVFHTTMGGWDHSGEGLGGWTLDAHHAYDPNSGTVFHGDGSQRVYAPFNAFNRVVGYPGASLGNHVSPLVADALPTSVAVAADGTIWYSEENRVRHITADGFVDTIAGNGFPGCGANDVPATTSAMMGVTSIEVLEDGSLIIAEGGCRRVRFVGADGNIHLLVGTTSLVPSVEGGLGTDTHLSDNLRLSFVGPDSILIADAGFGRIRRYDHATMRVHTVAGGGLATPDSVTRLATDLALSTPTGVDGAPDGSFVFAGSGRVYRVGIDGSARLVAGNGGFAFDGDGHDARLAPMGPTDVRLRPDGSLLIFDASNRRVRAVSNAGIIETIVGSGGTTVGLDGRVFNGWGRAGLNTNLTGLTRMAVAPDGAILLADGIGGFIGRINAPAPGFSATEIVIPRADGSALDVFQGATGCHMRTLDALTLHPRLSFEYVAGGGCRPSRVVLGDATDAAAGNVVEIDRQSPTLVQIRGPFSADGEHVDLTLDAAHNLASVAHGADTWTVTESASGLLQSLVDPLTRPHHYYYSTEGQLERDVGPDGAVTRLSTDPVLAGGFQVRRVLGAADATAPVFTHFSGWSAAHPTSSSVPGGNAATVISTENSTALNGHRVDVTSARSGTDPSVVLSTQETAVGPDPRLGAGVALPTEVTTTRAGRTVAVRHERTVMTSPTNSLQLVSQSDTTTVGTQVGMAMVYEDTPRLTVTYQQTNSACDNHGMVTETTRGGRSAQTCLDARGRPVRITVPGVEPVTFHYDPRGRIDAVTQAQRRQQITWRADGRVWTRSIGTWDGTTFTPVNTVTTGYDTSRRPHSLLLPGDRTIDMAVDAMGQTTSLTPPGRAAHTMGYNGGGRLASFTSPAAGGTTQALGWTFNARRQPEHFTRVDGSHVDWAYDEGATGHLNTMTFNTATSSIGALTFSYEPLTGAIDHVSDSWGCQLRAVVQNQTLPVGVVLESADGGTCPVRGEVDWTVNDLFETTSMTVVGAPAVPVVVTSDPDRLLTGAGGLTLTRDPSTGVLTDTSVGSGAGLVATHMTHTIYGESHDMHATVNGAAALGFVYNYDDHGRVGSVVETGAIGRTSAYDYDAAGRLWKVTRGGTVVEEYLYDDNASHDGLNGNRTSWTNASGTYDPGGTFTATYDARDRLTAVTRASDTTTYGYDAHDNVHTRTAGSSVTTYEWDPRGPLASVSRTGEPAISYVLDPQGRRIGRRVGGLLERGWLYGGGLLPVAEVGNDGTTVRRVFVYATKGSSPDLMLQHDSGGWVTYRILSDHLGSVRVVVNTTTGEVVQRMDYDAFGRVVDDTMASGWDPVPFGYAGGMYDRATGLLRLGAREYDAALGRWVSRDPIGFAGGDTNLYGYCANDPVNWVDVSGHIPIWFGIIVVGVAASVAWDAYSAYRQERAFSDNSGYWAARHPDMPYRGDQDSIFSHCMLSCRVASGGWFSRGVVRHLGWWNEAMDSGTDGYDDDYANVCGRRYAGEGGRSAEDADSACMRQCGAEFGTENLRHYAEITGRPGASDINPRPLWPENWDLNSDLARREHSGPGILQRIDQALGLNFRFNGF